MAYTRTYTVNSSAGGDTVKVAVGTKLDGDMTNIFADLTTHEAMTTNAHGVGSGTIVGTTLTQTLTNKTLSAPTLTGTVTSSGATISAPTLTGSITASGATFVSPTISAPTLTGVITASGATISAPTLVSPALGTPASGNLSNCTLATPPAIGETTPNTVRATNKEIFITSSATGPLIAAECSRTVVNNYPMTDADCAITLPTAAAGLLFTCILPTVRAKYFRLVAAGSDKIYLSGVAGSGGGYVGVDSGYATGTACSMFTFRASDGGYDWYCVPIFGTWVAG